MSIVKITTFAFSLSTMPFCLAADNFNALEYAQFMTHSQNVIILQAAKKTLRNLRQIEEENRAPKVEEKCPLKSKAPVSNKA